MRTAMTLIAAAFILASTAATAAKSSDKGEADLAKALAGRVAGKPVQCINLSSIRRSTIYPGTAIVYEVGKTLYVNRPSGSSFLHRDDILVTKTSTSQLCNVDIVHLMDSSSRFPTGSVGLNEFVPYKKVAG